MLRNFFLLVLCYLYAPSRGRAKVKQVEIKQPKTIVILSASKLGDMVCATPLFHAIKKQYPHCRVVVAGLANCSTVHDNNPDVDQYLILPTANSIESSKKLRAVNADVAIMTGPSFDAAATFFLAGVPTIIGPEVIGGFSPYQTKSYRLMWPLISTTPHKMGSYAPREYLKLLSLIGINSDDTTKHLGFSTKADETVSKYLTEHNLNVTSNLIVGMSVSAGNKIKKWDEDKWVELINWLSKEYKATIIFVGSKNDAPETEAVIGSLDKSTSYRNTVGVFSIDELKALISKVDLFISVDSGPIYVAEAFGIPTIDIVGPMDEREQPPIGDKHIVVVPPERKQAELHIMNARMYNAVEAQRQIDSITVDQVKNAASSLISKQL